MKRRLMAFVAVLALSALAFTNAGAAQPTGPVGTATTSLQLAEIVLEGVPGLDQTVELGSLLSYASTDGDAARNELGEGVPFALSSVGLPGGQSVTAQSNEGEDRQQGHSAALPAGAGTVTAGELRAAVVDGTASSLISALTGSLDAGLAGLAVGIPEHGSATLVDDAGSRAANGAVLGGLSLGLTDVLPTDLLAQLPLEVLLDLVGQLPVPLPAELDAVLAQVQTLSDELQTAVTDAVGTLPAQIDAVRAELDTLRGQVTDLRGQLDTTLSTDAGELATQITAVQTEIDNLVAEIESILALNLIDATVEEACADETLDLLIGDECDALAAAQAELEALETQLALVNEIAALEGQIADLETQLDGLIDQLLTALTDLIDDPRFDQIVALIEGLVADLLAGLEGIELLGVDRAQVGVATEATEDGSDASVLCTVSGVSVLGEAHGADTCEGLRAALTDVRGALLGLLGDLPIAGDVAAGVVTVGGLETTTQEGTDGDYRTATAAVSPLDLDVAPVGLTQVTDSIVDGLLGDLVAQLEALLAQLDAGDLVGTASTQGVSAAALPDDLAALVAELEGLIGADLTGVTTPALGIAGLGLSSTSEFNPAGTAAVPVEPPAEEPPTTDPVTPPTADTPGTPATTPVAQPGAPTPDGNLPRTGAALLGLALALTGFGGAGLWWSRRGAAA